MYQIIYKGLSHKHVHPNQFKDTAEALKEALRIEKLGYKVIRICPAK